MNCGLLGRTLGHSYSPQIHAQLGNYPYSLYEKEPQELEEFLRSGQFSALNVTVPYKKTVIPFLDELTDRARLLGAVNTIVRRNGRLIGHNTDYFGFETMLRRSGLNVFGKKTLVLGSGGASNTAVAVLRAAGANVVVISRSGENNYQNISLHSDATVIVNTTPVGMYPLVGISPLDLSVFPQLQGVLDVIYNPARTQLLLDAEKRGLVVMNGLLMLVAQAKEAAQWFLNTPIPDSKIDEIYHRLRKEMENIVLIGMPGCGKSTVGQALSHRTGRQFADADQWIVKLAGKSIAAIFAEDGEEVFRDWETQALEQLGKQSGLIIATGGGCVTKQRNYPLLHQNSRIFWLQRQLDLLPTDGRPLSQVNRLEDLYTQRRPMYERFADRIIDNSQSVEKTLDAILDG